MSEVDQLSRRDFLGMALFGPTAAAALGSAPVGHRPIYHGGMRELITRSPPTRNWHAAYHALIESVDISESEWRAHWGSALARYKQPGVKLPDLLRSRHVMGLCEAEYVPPRPCAPPLPSALVSVVVYDDVATCEASRRARETWIAGKIDDYPRELGEEACMSKHDGGRSTPSEIYFRRANVAALVSVQRHVPGYEIDRFAAILDRQIATRLSRTPPGVA